MAIPCHWAGKWWPPDLGTQAPEGQPRVRTGSLSWYSVLVSAASHMATGWWAHKTTDVEEPWNPDSRYPLSTSLQRMQLWQSGLAMRKHSKERLISWGGGGEPKLYYDKTNLHKFTKCLHVPYLIRILASPWKKSIINIPIFQTRLRKLREDHHHKVNKKGRTKSYFLSSNHDADHFLIIQLVNNFSH